VPLDGRVTIAQVSGGTYRIDGLGDFTGADGLYELTVDAAGVTDRLDNAGHGSQTVSWAKAAAVPSVFAIHGVSAARRNTPVEAVDVEFSQPINGARSRAAGPDPDPQRRCQPDRSARAGVTCVQTGPTSYRVSSLADVTLAEGDYHLTVSARA